MPEMTQKQEKEISSEELIEQQQNLENDCEEINQEVAENEDSENVAKASGVEDEEENAEEENLSELEILQKELKSLKDRYHRALADYQNLQRRSAKEVLEARGRGTAEFIKSLLPVLDTMDKAMEQLNNADIDKKVKDGLELFAIQLSDLLESAGLKEIPAVDNKFDPNFHEALCKRTDENKEDEIILTEFNRGYTFKGQVLRPSQVEINQR